MQTITTPATPLFSLSQGPLQAIAPARICAVGLGGAGGHAVAHIRRSGLPHVECLAMNADTQALALTQVDRQVLLGGNETRGMGAGGDPAVGARAAEENEGAITAALAGADLVFVAAGLGGGTGTGAAPIVARLARQQGALVVGLVTLPFSFEGRRRTAIAQQGLAALRDQVDTLVAIPNDRIFGAITPQTNLPEALRVTDEIVRQGVVAIADLVAVPGLVNLDLADLRAVMTGAGGALLAIGEADGAQRAQHAARLALTNPLLGLRAQGAHGLVCNITGGEDLTLMEVQAVAEAVGAEVNPDATLIFGAVTDDTFAGRIRVTVIATGFAPAQIPFAVDAMPTVPLTTSPPTVRRPVMPAHDSAHMQPQPAATGEPLRTRITHESSLIPAYLRRFKR